MASKTEKFNGLVTNRFSLFASFLFVVAAQIVAGKDVDCPSETYYFGPVLKPLPSARAPNLPHVKTKNSKAESIPITWPESNISITEIGSDCLKQTKTILARHCQTSGWYPTLQDIEDRSLCMYYRPPYVEYFNCPPGYTESGIGDVCFQLISSQPYDRCLETSGSSLSFLDLKSNEQFDILQAFSRRNVNIGISARNKWPSKQINSEIDYSSEDIELQWMLPGRYGSILRLSKNSAAVVCSNKYLCIDMCLAIDITQTTARDPYLLTVGDCSNIISVLCVSRKNSFLFSSGGTASGYYRVGYSTSSTLIYSIKMLERPLHYYEDSDTVVQDYCEANKLFQMDTLESLTIYLQLASVNKLGRNERCLFGILTAGNVIKASEWNLLDPDAIEFTNWDRSVDVGLNYLRSDSYLTVNSDGEWSWEASATCIVCAMDDPPSKLELILQFNISNTALILIVIAQQYLWRESDSKLGFLCFAVIANDYTEVPVKSTPTGYSLTNVGAGTYWCSGHSIQTLNAVSSEFVYAFGMVFAIYVKYHCNGECAEPFDEAGEFENFLNILIDKDLMQIEGLQYIDHDPDFTGEYVNIIFYVMLSVKDEISHHNEPNGIGLSENELYTYYALKELRRLHSDDDDLRFDIIMTNSMEFCLPDSIAYPGALNWKAAKVGETVELSEICLKFTRACSRNASNGAVWEDYTFQYVCTNQSQVSHNLFHLHRSFASPEQTSEVISNLSTMLQNVTLDPADVYIVSEIFEKVSYFLISDQISLSLRDLINVFEAFNDLMLVSQDVAHSSNRLNSTNSLLASLDEILLHQVSTLTRRGPLSNFVTSITGPLPDGVTSITNSLIVNYVIDPTVSGFSGIAFLENNATENNATAGRDFRNAIVRLLQPNQSVDALLKEDNLILASFVPQKLIESWNNPKIVLTLFANDVLFQSQLNQFSADATVISLSILNSSSEFSSPIPMFFKPNAALIHKRDSLSSQFCGYWSLSGSEWEGTGCQLNETSLQISNTILCECSHLTHFGNLVNTEVVYGDRDEKALNLITLTGCALSLLGIMGIFLTAMVFSSWRNKSSSKFLLQLSAAIGLQMILLIFIHSDDDVLQTISENLYECIAIGALVHYSILVMFFWMLIVAYLQFIRYVIVFNQITTSNFLLKSSLFGWGMPLLPVLVVVSVNPTSYVPTSSVKFCYPSGYGLLFGLLIPIALIVIANIFVFVAVVFSLIKASSKSAACKVNNKKKAIRSQLRLSVFLFFVLGLTWIFAFLSDRSVIFSYLFCLVATLQGLVLFFYFVVLDPIARNLWKRLFMKIRFNMAFLASNQNLTDAK